MAVEISPLFSNWKKKLRISSDPSDHLIHQVENVEMHSARPVLFHRTHHLWEQFPHNRRRQPSGHPTSAPSRKARSQETEKKKRSLLCHLLQGVAKASSACSASLRFGLHALQQQVSILRALPPAQSSLAFGISRNQSFSYANALPCQTEKSDIVFSPRTI